jgi:hypothetical protein
MGEQKQDVNLLLLKLLSMKLEVKSRQKVDISLFRELRKEYRDLRKAGRL